MPSIGINIAGGITQRTRVDASEKSIWKTLSGFDTSLGYLTPEPLCKLVSTNDIGAVTEQIPFAARIDGRTVALGIDANNKIRECEDADQDGDFTWNADGPVISGWMPKSPMAQLGAQIIIPTTGVDAKIMAYEPRSPSTKLRPLSLKSPYDYAADTRPAVTASFAASKTATTVAFHDNGGSADTITDSGNGFVTAGFTPGMTVIVSGSTSNNGTFVIDAVAAGTLTLVASDALTTESAGAAVTVKATAAIRLFGCKGTDPGGVWTSGHAGCTVDTTDTDAMVVFTIDSDVDKSEVIAKKSIGSAGINLNTSPAKHWLALDVKIAGDKQAYGGDVAGLFSNDFGMLPSGYELAFFDDTGCTAGHELKSLYIPKVEPEGMISRIAFRLEDLATTIKGVALKTSSFYVKPTSGEEVTITLYSEAFATAGDWSQKGNFLMPAIANDRSPWAAILTSTDIDVTPVLLESDNLLVNGSFEANGVPPYYSGGADTKDNRASDGARSVELDNVGEYVSWETPNRPAISPGHEYTLEYDYLVPYLGGGVIHILFTPDAGSPATDTRVFTEDMSTKWRTKKLTYVAPAGSTLLSIAIINAQFSDDLSIDNVRFYASDRVAPQSAFILQRFNTARTDVKPQNPGVEYCYIHMGRDLLSNPRWNLMLSNQSVPSTKLFYDPWRTYTVSITPPTQSTKGAWANSTIYAVGNLAHDSGVYYICLVAHTSHAAPYTFAQDRTAHPTYWRVTTWTPKSVITEYGDYVTHFGVYRRIFDGAMLADGTPVGWGAWTYMQRVAKGNGSAVTVADVGTEENANIEGRAIPKILQINNDYGSSARFAQRSNRRVIAVGLNWSEVDSVWKEALKIGFSSENKPWAWPTGVSEGTLGSDGSEEDNYAITGSEPRGWIASNDEIFLLLDSECFIVRGDNPLQGYQIIKVANIGGVAGTLAETPEGAIWHDGTDFRMFSGGVPQNISRGLVDSTLIEWDQPHWPVYAGNYYRLWCTYDGDHAVITRDLRDGTWRIRQTAGDGGEDDSYNFAGICSDGVQVFGLNLDGELVDLFGDDEADYGAVNTVRAAETQHVRIAEAGDCANVSQAVFEFRASQSADVGMVFSIEGSVANTQTPDDDPLTVTTTKTDYRIPLNLEGEAFAVSLAFSGVAPEVHFIGREPNSMASQVIEGG